MKIFGVSCFSSDREDTWLGEKTCAHIQTGGTQSNDGGGEFVQSSEGGVREVVVVGIQKIRLAP